MTRFTEIYINATNALALREDQVEGDRGAAMVEYALLVALIGVALIAVTTDLKDGIGGAFQDAVDAL